VQGRAIELSPPRSLFERWFQRAWWLHSLFALCFGLFVMVFARKGLAYADKLLMVLPVSWTLLFLALRFVAGAANTSVNETITKRGLRVVTNYVIKNLYQQMFFFLVPLYASSTTWSLSSRNVWLVPLLLACAVLSTLDVVFDRFIMERRGLASIMYGVCLFAVLNLMLPLTLRLPHFQALLIAAAATAPAVALLTFRVRSVFSLHGLPLTLLAAAGLTTGAWFGRVVVPPAPLAMAAGAVGHGSLGSLEGLPSRKTRMRAGQLSLLRCGCELIEPGGLIDSVIHVWTFRGRTVARIVPAEVNDDDPRSSLLRSFLPAAALPRDPVGAWTCRVETFGGQLVGVMPFEVVR
jgi:hypothetical protein